MKVHKAELRILVLASIVLVFTCAALCVEYTDDFGLERDFAAGQFEGTIWDGYLGELSTEAWVGRCSGESFPSDICVLLTL